MDSDTEWHRRLIFGDLERELAVTRKVLERLPAEQFAWKPHEKSMSLESLAIHVATLPDWIRGTLAQNDLDVASAPQAPATVADGAALLALFDSHVTALREVVGCFDVSRFCEPWSMRQGAEVMVTRPRDVVYRIWCLNHLIHHRAQLCVYLRLLNVPVPTVYFNTADDPNWMFD